MEPERTLPTSLLDMAGMQALWRERRWSAGAWRGFERELFWRAGDLRSLPAQMAAVLGRIPATPLVPTNQSVAGDGTLKVLFETRDGQRIESVLMRYGGRDGKPERYSVCVSSQVGCAARCVFCATGTMKAGRNLFSDEILAQICYFNNLLIPRGRRVQNLVFMGMGEPLLNCDQVFEAIASLADQRRLSLGPRQITLSSVGIGPGLERLVQARLPLSLAISLHAAEDALRSRIVPINKKYPLERLMPLLDRWTDLTRRRILYEYVMLRDLNDSEQQAREVVELLQGRPAYLNLIPYNPGPGQMVLSGSERERIYAFAQSVRAGGIRTIVRHTFGQEIAAACGQLALAAGPGA